jgi:hypothetical protein
LREYLRRAVVDLGPLRHRDFRLLFGGQAVSLFGSEMTYIAVPYQAYLLTHSSLVVGLLGAAELGPLLVMALVGGALADAPAIAAVRPPQLALRATFSQAQPFMIS